VARAGRFALTLTVNAVLGCALGLLVALALPLAFDARPLTVLSGSMEPTLTPGDVVVVKRIAPADARVGDVVTSRDPRGRLVTHRVRSVRPRGTHFELVTQGDANNASERWTIERGGELSRSLYRVPLAGRVLALTGSPPARLALFVLPLLLLGAWEVRRIWRPREAPA
jgi:signal peptidase